MIGGSLKAIAKIEAMPDSNDLSKEAAADDLVGAAIWVGQEESPKYHSAHISLGNGTIVTGKQRRAKI